MKFLCNPAIRQTAALVILKGTTYSVIHQVADLDRVDFEIAVPQDAQLLSQFCQSPISPSRIKVNKTLVREPMEHPVARVYPAVQPPGEGGVGFHGSRLRERRPGTNCIKIDLPGKLILSKRKGLREVSFS